MINLRIFGVTLVTVVTVAASIGLVTIGFQSTMASIMLTDLEEAVEAGNATTTMMTNQTAGRNMTGVEFLSMQTAKSGSISQINETAYTLELKNVSDSSIMFSDRPERIVTSVSTSDFVGNWTVGPNSFESDVPNDALIVRNTETGELETAIIESFAPVYDIATNSLTYTIATENATSINLPDEFGQSILVIDMIWACGGHGVCTK